MDDAKKGFLPMRHGLVLNKAQSPSTKDERECMRMQRRLFG